MDIAWLLGSFRGDNNNFSHRETVIGGGGWYEAGEGVNVQGFMEILQEAGEAFLQKKKNIHVGCARVTWLCT